MKKLNNILNLISDNSNCFSCYKSEGYIQYVKINTISINWAEKTVVFTGMLIDMQDERISIANKFNISEIIESDARTLYPKDFDKILNDYITSLKDG